MSWSVECTDQYIAWYESLDDQTVKVIDAAIEILEEDGPSLGRPIVDTIKTSRHPNMKELRPSSSNLRILFAFDPRRSAILLVGGDKSGQWSKWYDRMVPVADRLYDEYLEEIQREGLLP